jgi:hypothetical protein
MRAIVTKALLLCAAFVLLYAVVFTVLVKVRIGGIPVVYRIADTLNWKGGSTWQKFQEFDPGKRWDVVVVGSSHAYRGYDPEHFTRRGYRMFNLGTSAQAPNNSVDIVRHYLHAGNTGLLILDVFETPLRTEGLEGVADLTQNVASDAVALRQALALRDPRGINMLALRWLMRNEPPMYLDSTYVGLGFSRRADSLTDPPTHIHTGTFEPKAEQVRALQRIIRICHQRGIPLVLTNHPMPHQADHAAHARAKAWMEEWTAVHDLPFVDLANDHDLHDMHHFYDHTHMNQAGVDLFMPRLIDTLESLGLLRRPMHPTNP